MTCKNSFRHPLYLNSLEHRLFSSISNRNQWPIKPEESILEPFVNYALKKKFSFGWSIHIHFLHWLKCNPLFQILIDERFIYERMQAALRDWALNGWDHIPVKGMLLYLPSTRYVAWGIWKSDNALQPHRFVQLKFSAPLSAEDAFAYSYEYNLWSLNLQSIPL